MFVNTAQEFDGSDAGARPDEAVSWGKISLTAKPATVVTETAEPCSRAPVDECKGSLGMRLEGGF